MSFQTKVMFIENIIDERECFDKKIINYQLFFETEFVLSTSNTKWLIIDN